MPKLKPLPKNYTMRRTVMLIEIPNYKSLKLQSLVLDYNGTIACDGYFKKELSAHLEELADSLKIYLLSADTFGSVTEQMQGLPVEVHILKSKNHTEEKAAFIEQIGADSVAAIGNGNNDALMLKRSALGIAVLGEEGLSLNTLNAADILAPNIVYALELLLKPKRLIATLRR